MKLLIVIVNYRTPELTVDCLRSLRDEVGQVEGGARVVVTDNASPDDSAERIAAAMPEFAPWATFMSLDRNGGFAWGNNQAIAPALRSDDPPEYVHLLNPDTLVLPGGIVELVKFMDAHRQAGIAGSRIENPDGSVRRSAFRFHTIPSEFESEVRLGAVSKLMRNRVIAPEPPAGNEKVDWVSGASMIVRRKVFDDIGLLDEGYFMYYEEADFALRANRAGWPCWYVPASRVVHLVGQASGVTGARRAEKRRPSYWFDSRRRYFVNNHGHAAALFADVAWTSGAAIHRVLRFVRCKQRTDPAWLLWDFLRHTLRSWMGLNRSSR